MGLARKLTASLAVGILLVMAAYAAMMIRSEVRIFRADLKKNARVIRALTATVEDVWRSGGAARARALVEEADDEIAGLGVRIARLDVQTTTPRANIALSSDEIARVRRGEMLRLVRDTDTGDRRRHTFFRLDVPAKGLYALELFESLRDQLTFIRMNRIGVIAAALAVTGVCTLIVMLVASRLVGRPIRMLAEQARRIGAGDLSQRLGLRQRDEIGDLARELDAMCDLLAANDRRLLTETDARIAALEQLRHSERLATVGQLASGVAHQLGTPLNVIAIRAKMIAEAAGNNGPGHDAQVIAEQAERMTAIVRRLLDFSRRKTVERGRGDLARVVARTVELVAPVAERRRVFVRRDLPERPLEVDIDEEQLQHALTNVVLNGVQATPPGGTVTVRAGERPVARPGARAASTHPFVTVEDQGPGIPADRLPRLFEPFYTTKPPGEGTGLGLSVAQEIVRDHDGWIVVGEAAGGGAAFTVFLPPADAAVEQAS